MDNSPYPEVRAAVTTDIDVNVHLNHWRSWFLTTVFVIVFSGVNQFFSLHYPTISIDYVVAQVISFPIGKALEKLPDIRFPRAPFFNLNPGPFTPQEHALLTIVVSLTASTSYAMNILIAQTNFYDQDLNIGYQILLVLSTQLLGYGAAGLTRRWIVYPASMTWPQSLITCTVFNTLSKSLLGDNLQVSRFNISRYRMFAIVGTSSFVWYWFPGFIFKALSYFNWVCWIAPKNIVVNQIFGTSSGLGIIPITFDWTQITQALGVSPLATPFWVAANTYGSVFLFFVIVLPCLYYTNTWDAKYMPMMSTTTYDNTASKYNVTKVLDKDLVLNKAAYKAYSPLMVPYSYLLSYALNFAAVLSIFTHTYLYHGKDIMGKLRNSQHGGEDIHKRLMNRFNEVPDWWYGLLWVISVGLSFAAVCGYPGHTQLPWWGLVVSLGITFVGFIPQGLLEGITNQHVGLNIVTELVAGYIWPGKPIANMMVKLYGFIPMRQGLNFSRDLKLGQYMKVPPRTMFFMQIWGTIWACLVNVGVQQWMRFHVKGICSSSQSDGFTCAQGRTIFNASIIWGAVGPKELFSLGKRYNAIMYFFLIGAIFPIFTWLLWRRNPTKWYGKINGPVFFTGSGNIPPSTLYNYSLYFVTCYVFNSYIKDNFKKFHTKYNNVISAGFDAGVALSIIIIFLCVVYPGGKLNWWGNTVYQKTLDYEYAPFYTLKKGQTFGPKEW
ncbi:hypothetical protein BABINDRAFT_178904 [Babjeviella inositovora NRRL Y-12698]|uniref:OPT family small oligopeptide transporter n=1 Tax=Babjeviella inositovora NRRL Y-12698 TaxID=984486 RepID=A0A1E3QYM9_9ASCO|nr:uncharacterized protein BABINDRAFT_178904 [Babjeviella inositovora NRRL Y-12698]ODQ82773.1 hypothetical protein BABINDRAFT_178904 [Babjeviella inositovora NRRL Y-12698]